MSAPTTEALMKAFRSVAGTDGKKSNDVWVQEHKKTETKGDQSDNQFIIFIKPEGTAADVKVDAVWELVTRKLQDAKVRVGGVRVLSGDFLNDTGIMSEHYGVISKISREGAPAITPEAAAKLDADFKDFIAAGAQVLGAHQLLAKEPSLSPYSLRILNDNLGTTRLAGGTYAMKLTVMGANYLVLNPFHPYQLVPYTTKGHAIIVIEGLSKTSFAALRNDLCGATDPAKAKEGSIRRALLDTKDALGLTAVNMSNNGIHMSAGPVEAFVELRRFFAVDGKKPLPESTHLGGLLASSGVAEAVIAKLETNPQVKKKDGKQCSLFDATEEKDLAEVAAALASGDLTVI